MDEDEEVRLVRYIISLQLLTFVELYCKNYSIGLILFYQCVL